MVPRYTFVTVIYEDDYPAMTLQACTMDMFLPREMVERIIIIDNSSEENLFNIDTVLPHYGSLDACVTVIRRRDLTPIEIAGWQIQQLLKLEVAKRISTERYVVLDAKNHLCYPVPSDFFERPDGTLKTFLENYTLHPMRKTLENVLSFWALDPKLIAAYPPTHTPFCFERQKVLEMFNFIERKGRRFSSVFLEEGLTEFFTYSGYLIKTGVRIDYQATKTGGVWDTDSGDEDVRRQLRYNRAQRRPFFSVHRNAIPLLSVTAKRLLLDFWQERGIPQQVLPFARTS